MIMYQILKELIHNRIGVVGESFGAYLSCNLSKERHLKAIALRVPTDFPNDGFYDKPHKDFVGSLSFDWKSKEHSPKDSFALEAMNSFDGDILIVASEKDDIVPIQTTKNYIASVSNPEKFTYKLVKGARHSMLNPIEQMKYIQLLIQWFDNCLNINLKGDNNMGNFFLKMQKDMMNKIQGELENINIKETDNNNFIMISMNGNNEIKDLRINKEFINSNSIDMLQNLIIDTVNRASRKINKIREEKYLDMSKNGNLKIFGALFQKMQKDAMNKKEEFQKELENIIVKEVSNDNMLMVSINGNKEIKELKINKEIINSDDIRIFQNLINETINEALKELNKKLDELKERKISESPIGTMFGLGNP